MIKATMYCQINICNHCYSDQ